MFMGECVANVWLINDLILKYKVLPLSHLGDWYVAKVIQGSTIQNIIIIIFIPVKKVFLPVPQ